MKVFPFNLNGALTIFVFNIMFLCTIIIIYVLEKVAYEREVLRTFRSISVA